LPGGVHTRRYMVEPGKKVDQEEWDPNDTSGFEGGEQKAHDVSASLDKSLDGLQEKLYAEHKHKMLVVLQAMDTAGKDGVIRRIFEGVNPSGVSVAHFREPTPEEHDFLWRVHAKTPGLGELTIFNRSHYEGVLVERVHKIVPKEVWKRRYRQINDFERMLAEEGTTILKFYLHIDSEEQKKRLHMRLADPNKQWKFSKDDVVERKLWSKYMRAYGEMLEETSTEWAPWYVVPSNHRWFRDILVASVVVKALEGLDMKYPALDVNPRSVRIPS
jgi:PPK2 family polyphosphate:nucleotide phosphotransferase